MANKTQVKSRNSKSTSRTRPTTPPAARKAPGTNGSYRKLQRYVRSEDGVPVEELTPLARHLPVIELFEYRDWDMVRQNFLHSHDNLFQLDHFPQGEGIYIINDVPYPIEPNTFFFIPPGTKHSLAGTDKTTLVALSVKYQYDMIGPDFLPPAFQADAVTLERVRYLIRSLGDQLYDDARHTLPASLALAQALVILHEAANESLESRGEHVRVVAAKRFMEEHFSEPLTLADIAEAAGVGGAHLCRLFKQETGSTPFEYLRRVRLIRAKYWLHQSKEKIARIAEATGFGTAQELNRTFQKLEHMSPREFRKRIAGEDKSVSILSRSKTKAARTARKK